MGPKGSGQFERISWDEALDEVAGQMRRIRDAYGPAAILDCSRTGSTAVIHNRAVVQRLLHLFGGCTELWSSLSNEAEIFALRHTYGPQADCKFSGREPSDYVNSRLMILWGWSPADGTFGTNNPQYLHWAHQHGVRMVSVDPRATRTSLKLADEHVAIRPGTDAAMLIAMAQVIVSENLHDQAFLDRLVLGFDEAHLPEARAPGSSYRSYLLGLTDGVVKTPEWAEPLTGVPAATIRRLAREFGTVKPAALQCGYAPGRTGYGEQFHRAAYALCAITGNIGIPGGSTGCSGGTSFHGIKRQGASANPVNARVASTLLADLLERGQAGGYPADIKMVYSACGDLANQCPNVNKITAGLERLEFMVAHDHFLTPTARYADIVLPATTFWERSDMHTPWSGAGHYVIFMQQAIPPCTSAATTWTSAPIWRSAWGSRATSAPPDLDWLREVCQDTNIDDFDTFREKGLARLPAPEDPVAFAREVRDPERYPSRRRRERSRSTRPPSPPIPICTGWDAFPPSPRGFLRTRTIPAIPSSSSRPSRAPAPTRPTTISPSCPARTSRTCGCTPPTPPLAASSTGRPCACSTSAAPPSSPPT